MNQIPKAIKEAQQLYDLMVKDEQIAKLGVEFADRPTKSYSFQIKLKGSAVGIYVGRSPVSMTELNYETGLLEFKSADADVKEHVSPIYDDEYWDGSRHYYTDDVKVAYPKIVADLQWLRNKYPMPTQGAAK
jgi:hypothetical protein